MVAFVGLTGGMGAGKSTALQALQRLGAAVISSDAVVHELYESERVRDAVIERLGTQVAPDGRFDRSAVAERVFANREDREWLEGLLWPLVAERVTQWLSEVRATRPAPRAAVVEVPLLFEAGLEGIYDATIAVVSDESLRAERAAARGHALIDERDARQLAQSEKAERATYTVCNDGEESELQERLEAILSELDNRAP